MTIPRPPHKTALVLIDIENAIGARAQPSVALARLTVLLEHAPAEALVVAACPPSRIRPDVARALTDHGVKMLSAGTGPNAADKVLLNRARQAAAEGVRHFTVVSADAAFASLASLGELHVLAWDKQPVGKQLAKAAAVSRIPCIRRAPAPVQPLTAQTSQIPAPDASAPTPLGKPSAKTVPTPHAPQPWSTVRWGGAAVTVMFCGGLAFGAGSALGSRLVHLAVDAVARPGA
ncbi:hypothetical protein [Streptomyces monomycini]|uniref:hypothetical protein n=1 Tax=Streptomyces monomycini TaxID=371720 RepID=UPI0004AB5C4B|nr:hypothetical protein [Streptomyces monomycini]